jgi:hypothetical protein
MRLRCNWARIVTVGRSTSVPQAPFRFCGDASERPSEVALVMAILKALVGAFLAVFRPKASLVVENSR